MIALWALVFFGVLLALSKLVRPDRKTEASRNAFSSGEKPSGEPWIRIRIRYQVLISVATVFFLGVLILYPAVATFRQWIEQGRGSFVLAAVGVFFGTLSVSLAYAWMNGDLNWIRDDQSN
jgi:NADH-quinone oxidoreductase subunit A